MNIRIADKFFIFVLISYGVLYFSGHALHFITHINTNPEVMWRDFDQDYLLAKAALSGVNPYLPLPELAKLFGDTRYSWFVLSHPSPHPPTTLFWILPLAFLGTKSAGFVWLACSLLAAFFSARIIVTHIFNKIDLKYFLTILLFLIILLLLPSQEDLKFGQFGFFLLLFVLSASVALRNGENFTAGAFLGAALSLKPFLWPLILMFIFSRNLKAICGMTATFLPTALFAYYLIGYDGFQAYLYKAIPETVSTWYYFPYNLTLNNFFTSFFTPQFIEFRYNFSMPFHLEQIDSLNIFILRALDALVAILFIGVVFYSAIKSKKSSNETFLLITCASVLISPLSWIHYALLFIPLLSFFIVRYINGEIQRKSFLIGMLLCLPIFFPPFFHLGNDLMMNAYLNKFGPGLPPGVVPVSAIGMIMIKLSTLGMVSFILYFLSSTSSQKNI